MQTPLRQFKVISPAQKRREARNRLLRRAAILTGLFLITACGAVLWQVTPRVPRVIAPATWPQASHLVRNFTAPTMVLFVEPEQVGARDNLEELDRLVTYNRMAAYVIFAGDQPEPTLLDQAKNLPNTTVIVDRLSREAGQFQLSSAGNCLLFDRFGKLQFHGDLAASDPQTAESLKVLLSGRPVAPVASLDRAASATAAQE